MSTELDTRIHAVNLERGVVEAALAGQFPGLKLLSPRPAWAAAGLSLRARPDPGAAQVTEALPGEALEVLEELDGGWSWVRSVHDGYLGYIQADLTALSETAPTRPIVVQVPRTHLYSAPSIKALPVAQVGCGAAFSPLDAEAAQHGDYFWWRVSYLGAEAYLHCAATSPLEFWTDSDPAPNEAPAPDDPENWTEQRLTFLTPYLNTPYVWGGRTAWGLDCSGLAQLYAGKDQHGRSRLPRDADQQQAATQPISYPKRGDLAFFPGHVGIMMDDAWMIHANATHLRVTSETLGRGVYGRKLQSELLGFGRLREQA